MSVLTVAALCEGVNQLVEERFTLSLWETGVWTFGGADTSMLMLQRRQMLIVLTFRADQHLAKRIPLLKQEGWPRHQTLERRGRVVILEQMIQDGPPRLHL